MITVAESESNDRSSMTSYGVSVVRILETIDNFMTAPLYVVTFQMMVIEVCHMKSISCARRLMFLDRIEVMHRP